MTYWVDEDLLYFEYRWFSLYVPTYIVKIGLIGVWPSLCLQVVSTHYLFNTMEVHYFMMSHYFSSFHGCGVVVLLRVLVIRLTVFPHMWYYTKVNTFQDFGRFELILLSLVLSPTDTTPPPHPHLQHELTFLRLTLIWHTVFISCSPITSYMCSHM